MDDNLDFKKGYTLIELIIVLIVIAVLAGVAIPTVGNILNGAKIKSAEKEMRQIVKAIVGDSEFGVLGYLDEVGSMPLNLNNLIVMNSLSPYNPFTRTGWNGPYLDTSRKDINHDGSVSANEYDILYDPWGNPYVYNSGAETISSNGPDMAVGGGDDIVVNIRQ